MNKELKLKLENFFQLNEENLMQETEDSLVYINYKEKYQISVMYNQSKDAFLGTLYFNLGNITPEKVSDFEFYNSVYGDIEFKDEFSKILLSKDTFDKKGLIIDNVEEYVRGEVLSKYPLYVSFGKDGITLILTSVKTSESEELSYFLNDYLNN